MKLKNIICLLIGWLPCITVADTLQWEFRQSIHPHMIPFQFQYWTNTDEENEYFAYLQINGPNGNTIQKIPQLNLDLSINDIEFLDVNFDGMLEIKVKTPSLAVDSQHQFFKYNSISQNFVEDKKLAELKNMDLDSEQKWIKTTSQTENSQKDEYYQYQNGELQLIKQVLIECKQGLCEQITFVDQGGVLVEQDRASIEDSFAELNEFLEHLVSRKGVCLDKVKQYALSNEEIQGLNEANQCLNMLAFDIIPLVQSSIQDRPITLQFKQLLDHYAQFVKDVTVCSPYEKNCESQKQKAALEANIYLVDQMIERMVVNITRNDFSFDSKKWLANWEGLNSILQPQQDIG